MHVFVAGGSGYVGSALVELLLARGDVVTVLARSSSLEALGAALPDARGLHLVHGDTRSFDRSALAGQDAVVDLAGLTHDRACDREPDLAEPINVGGARRPAELARAAGVKRHVYASSCAVYGRGVDLTETSPLDPQSRYARTKVAAERALLSRSDPAHVVVALRLATSFGLAPRARFDVAINAMTKNALEKGKLTVEGPGRQLRPFIHVRDAADAFARAIVAPPELVSGQIFNIGTANGSIAEVARRVAAVLPGTEVSHTNAPPDPRDYSVSFDKAAQVLGWRGSRTIEDGVRELSATLRRSPLAPSGG